jgi:hypothetical protein
MIEAHQAPSTDLLRDIVRRACDDIDDKDLCFGLRQFVKWYTWTVRSNKAMYNHYRRMLDRLALKEEHIRELIIRDATPEERKRMLQPGAPYEYTEAGRRARGRSGGHGD